MPQLLVLTLLVLAAPLFGHDDGGARLGHDPVSHGLLDHGGGAALLLAFGLLVVAWRATRRRAR